MIIMVWKLKERIEVSDILNPIRIGFERSVMRTVKKQSIHEVTTVSDVVLTGFGSIENRIGEQ